MGEGAGVAGTDGKGMGGAGTLSPGAEPAGKACRAGSPVVDAAPVDATLRDAEGAAARATRRGTVAGSGDGAADRDGAGAARSGVGAVPFIG
jgi:hypothetical protein